MAKFRQFSRHHLSYQHYLLLAMILLVGAVLRFWQLDAKAMWLDEVITALFGLGRSYSDIPLNQWITGSDLENLFTLQSGVSCALIIERLTTESTHPPLFFCLLHQWLHWLHLPADRWVWALRSLPALAGVAAIAALYTLNRIAFSPTAGLWGAGIMAVSPFAVYLSQEARHYTLPILWITLGLIGLVLMQQDLIRGEFRLWVWLGWVGVNLLGLYTHYFCGLALVAQIGALASWMVVQREKLPHWYWGALLGAIATIGLGYLPWLPHLLIPLRSSTTAWLVQTNPDWSSRLSPLLQTFVGWVLMVVAFPVEGQPLAVAAIVAIGMLSLAGWIFWQGSRQFRQLWRQGTHRPSLWLISGFTAIVLLQFFAIIYLLHKDLSIAPRYNFVYFPGVCALLGAVLSLPPQHLQLRRLQAVVVVVGLLSSLFVVHDLAFQKSFFPRRAAQRMAIAPSGNRQANAPNQPLALAVAYRSNQNIALGLSYALELKTLYAGTPNAVRFGFLNAETHYEAAWKTLAALPQSLPLPLNLWLLADSDMRQQSYPLQLQMVEKTGAAITCTIDPEHYHRVGSPYQLYRCDR